MHGATLLDAQGEVLRPCILWNDGRSDVECAELERDWPALRQVTGNIAMPGFTAPKLLWVRKHEPADLRAHVAKVLLPKAYLRWRLSGEYAEDMSDASGTLWLDVGARRWSEAALAACGMRLDQMPRLVEGSEVAGQLAPDLVGALGLHACAADRRRRGRQRGRRGRRGRGAPGRCLRLARHLGRAVGHHGAASRPTRRARCTPSATPCPNTWHQMGVLLSAAVQPGLVGLGDAVATRPSCSPRSMPRPAAPSPVWFAPYLSGERTPHNDTRVRGGFLGLAADTSRADMTRAVLEGVAYALADAQQSLAGAGTVLHEAALIGGGARSPLWAQILADVLGIRAAPGRRERHRLRARRRAAGAHGGRRRHRRRAAGAPPAQLRTPRRDQVALHRERHAHWQRLYPLARDFAR